MKPISHTTLLRKSRNYRNNQAIQRLANIDSLRDWVKNSARERTPQVEIKKVEPLYPGIYNLIRNLKP